MSVKFLAASEVQTPDDLGKAYFVNQQTRIGIRAYGKNLSINNNLMEIFGGYAPVGASFQKKRRPDLLGQEDTEPIFSHRRT